ncbi:hypothetical protein [Variovorax gossypii]
MTDVVPAVTPANALCKEWEAQQTYCASWDAPYLGTPSIVVLEVSAREPSTGALGPKTPGQQRPLHFILVERRLNFTRAEDGEIEEARIDLRYSRIGGWTTDSRSEAKGSMSAGYSRRLNTISLAKSQVNGTTGAVFLTMQGGIPRGVRIGTYLMNEIVAWAKHWPEAEVQHIALVPGQAVDEEDRRTRNAFWRKFGLKLRFDDPQERGGHSLPMKAADLTPCTRWKLNITVTPLLKFAAQQQEALASERQLNNRLNSNAKDLEIERLAQRRHPFLWAWKVFYETRIEPFQGRFVTLLLLASLIYGIGRLFSWWG